MAACAHNHDHDHPHGGHGHHHGAEGMSEGRLRLSITLTFLFVALEAVVGLRSNSLALLSDAGHNVTDGLALGLSWYAITIARRPPNPSKTYGYHRVGILTALFNSMTLLVIAAFIFWEAYRRFVQPAPVESGPMMAVALCGLFMNTVIALWLRGEAAHSVNMRSAFIHMVGDALSSAGVVVAGAVIYFTHWYYADPIVSLLIGGFIVYSSWGIILETINVLLEGTPRGLDVDEMAGSMQRISGVMDVHDLHVWTIADGMNALSCHLRILEADISRASSVVGEVKTLLAERYQVRHSTIETECVGCDFTERYCRLEAHASDHTHDASPTVEA